MSWGELGGRREGGVVIRLYERGWWFVCERRLGIDWLLLVSLGRGWLIVVGLFRSWGDGGFGRGGDDC